MRDETIQQCIHSEKSMIKPCLRHGRRIFGEREDFEIKFFIKFYFKILSLLVFFFPMIDFSEWTQQSINQAIPNMRKACFTILSCLLAHFLLQPTVAAQDISPKREFRGAWIATVANIDFPSVQGLDRGRFSEEWLKTLDNLQEAGFNAVLAQVRPAGDAFYRSKISPWSKYLSGTQGKPIDEDFDPMQFMIQTAHARNMEFHAWLNPYRASMDTNTVTLSDTHPYKHRPEWFLNYAGKMYFNPARPEVRNYIAEVVMEIVLEYDVDAIHFDDYFYPYPAAGEVFPDSTDFRTYGFGHASIGDWRRHNVDLMIAQVSQVIRRMAPHVRFGISPFGVWRNVSKDPVLGSATRAGINTYDDLYADVRGWLEKGWIDYVAPQLYWHIGFQVADYEILLKWWSANSFDRHLYIGHAMYKVNNNPEEAWKRPGEIPKQIRMNRQTPGVQGSIYYNTNSVMKNPLGVTDSLRNQYYTLPALLPELPHLGVPVASAPSIGKPRLRNSAVTFDCNVRDMNPAASYLVVYRFEDRLPGDYNNPQNILQIIPLEDRNKVTVEDKRARTGQTYTYAVSVANRAHTESMLSNWRAVGVGPKRLKRLK